MLEDINKLSFIIINSIEPRDEWRHWVFCCTRQPRWCVHLRRNIPAWLVVSIDAYNRKQKLSNAVAVKIWRSRVAIGNQILSNLMVSKFPEDINHCPIEVEQLSNGWFACRDRRDNPQEHPSRPTGVEVENSPPPTMWFLASINIMRPRILAAGIFHETVLTTNAAYS